MQIGLMKKGRFGEAGDALRQLRDRPEVVERMLGGPHAAAQVPSLEAREKQLVRRLLHRAGTEGKRLSDVRQVLCRMRVYAQEVLKVPP